jgi:hypothetical protein
MLHKPARKQGRYTQAETIEKVPGNVSLMPRFAIALAHARAFASWLTRGLAHFAVALKIKYEKQNNSLRKTHLNDVPKSGYAVS